MARCVREPWGTARGPRAGQPSQTQRIMVLESERRECMAKKRPARPRAARVEDPLPELGREVFGLTLRVERRMERRARRMPVLFQPPLGPCMMGQVGLLV